MGSPPKIRIGCGGGPPPEKMSPPPKFGCGGGGGGGGSRPGALERTPARAVCALPPLMEEIDWTPKILKIPKTQVVGGDDGDGDGAKPDALKRTDELVKEAVASLPPPPGRDIWLNGARKDNDDPVALALEKRGIHPEQRYDPYFDLFLHRRPLKEDRLRAWMRFPLKLHDSGLVEAERSMITWGPGLSGRRSDFSSEITGILELHPGPIACLRVDDSAFPAPERLRRWIDILTEKEVHQLILLNLTRPEEATQAALHHLRSRRLTYLAIGFVNIRACLRLAMEGADLDGHPWSSLKGLTLICCAFDAPDLSQNIGNLPCLKNLSIQSCSLTLACSEDGLQIKSLSLVMLQLWRCTADHKITIGPAPALTNLVLGVVSAPNMAVATPPPPVEILITQCNDLKIVDQVDLQKQYFSTVSKYKRKILYFQEVFVLPFLNTLVVAVEMATTEHASVLLNLLRYVPNLKDLTVQRVDNSTSSSDGCWPHFDSACCIANSLQRLTMQQFRGGSLEVQFVVNVLAAARFLMTLALEPLPAEPVKPQDATNSVQTHPKTLRWQDAASYFSRYSKAARGCELVVVPPTSYQT